MSNANLLPPFKRLCVTIGNLPSSYVDSMSYYECLMWLCNYLENTVVPTVNENALAVNELINWFNTLDVQDEIDHKLDEMAESGELQEIISEYLNSTAVFGFDSVSDMQSATNLIDGSYAKTLGFYELNDEGGATYKIRTITNEDVVDNCFLIPLDDETLIAELIIEDSTVNVKQLGAKGDSVIEDGHLSSVGTDNTTIFQTAIDKVHAIGGGIVYVPNGNYAVGSLDIDTTKGITIKGNMERYAGTNATIVTTSSNTFNIQTPTYNFHLEDLNFLSSLSTSSYNTKLINLLDGGFFQRCVFKNLTIANYKYALDLTTPSGNDFTDGAIFENINFRTVYGCIKAKHLEATTINNCSAEPFLDYFLYLIQSGGVSVTNCIMRGLATQGGEIPYGIISLGTSQNGRNVFIRNCLSEDIDCFALLGTPNTIIENCRYTINRVSRLNPIILGRYGGASADNTTLINMIVNYEVSSDLKNVYIHSGNVDYTIDGTVYTVGNMTNTITNIEGIPLTYQNANDSRKVTYKGQWSILNYNGNKRIFVGASSLTEGQNAPDGTAWVIGDIVLYYYNATSGNRHNHIIGSIYTQTGSSSYEWLPITLGVDHMNAAETSTYSGAATGQMSFDTTNNKPMWWNGTKWVYADGTDV